jgi:cytochrome c oxidase subunit 2
MEHRWGGVFLAALIWLIGIGVVIIGSRPWMPELASQHGAGIDRMIHFTMTATGSLILLGHIVLGLFVWKFSRQTTVTFRLASSALERRWSLMAALLMAGIAEGGVLYLGLPVWDQVFTQQAPADALTIEVTTEQFAWNVRYAGPDGVFGKWSPKLITLDNVLGVDTTDPAGKDDLVDLNSLHVAVNRPVKIRLRSKDVLHSFFLPNLRVKQDSVPGMTIELWFVPNKTGTFELACAELCGLGHYEMRGILVVMTPEDLQKWFEEKKNNG